MSSVQSEGQRKPAIVILDFGSQYSELIARRVRETEVFSLVLGYSTNAEELRALAPVESSSVEAQVRSMPMRLPFAIQRFGIWASLCWGSATACS